MSILKLEKSLNIQKKVLLFFLLSVSPVNLAVSSSVSDER